MIEERVFAFFCFFKDCESVRDTLKEAWVGYKQGRVSLLAASPRLIYTTHFDNKATFLLPGWTWKRLFFPRLLLAFS